MDEEGDCKTDTDNNGQEVPLDTNLKQHETLNYNDEHPLQSQSDSSTRQLIQNTINDSANDPKPKPLTIKYWRSNSLPATYLSPIGILHQNQNGDFELLTQANSKGSSSTSPNPNIISFDTYCRNLSALQSQTKSESEKNKSLVLHNNKGISSTKGKVVKDLARASSTEQVCTHGILFQISCINNLFV